MKKIHLTESQMKKIISELTLDGDEALNTTKNIQTATRDTIMNAKNSGVNIDNTGTQVSFSADTLKKNGMCEEEEHEPEYTKYTKKQVNEARINKMMKEGCTVTTKKTILNGR